MDDFSTVQNERLRLQVGALPYRIGPRGLEFLLVTSASRGRWIIPKGNVEPHLGMRDSAQQEAVEEAGVRGYVHPSPLGSYVNARPTDPTAVTVFPLRVETEIGDDRWIERHVRQRRWMSPRDAISVIEEADLQDLLRLAAELLE